MSMDGRKMLKIATNPERFVVINLAIAAGLLWRCRMSYCAELNDGPHKHCVKCGASRVP